MTDLKHQVNEPCIENCSFNTTPHISHLNPHFPLYLCFPFISSTFSLPTLCCPFSPLSSFPLCRLSTHWFHVLLLSFSILTCLAHFSVAVNWILYFQLSALALPAELCFSFFHLLLSRQPHIPTLSLSLCAPFSFSYHFPLFLRC